MTLDNHVPERAEPVEKVLLWGSPDLQKYLTRNNIRGEHRSRGLVMMRALAHVGFVPSHCAWWLQWDSDEGERVFADFFFEPGVCRLLWKDRGSANTQVKVLELCDVAGVPAIFPFEWRD